MEKLRVLTASDLAKVTHHRSGEVKFGEKMLTVPKGILPDTFLRTCEAPYVLVGIPEDIGVRANFGKPGAASAWQSALSAIANIQHNRFCKGSRILALGALNVDAEMEAVAGLDFYKTEDRTKMTELVSEIDREVAHLVFSIVKAGKKPIIIGGGQNNAYGAVKGMALATGKPINAVNFDAHSDFRIMEGRHNGNAFTYAFEEGFLKKYFIFGLHESYTSKNVLHILKDMEDRVRFNTYDAVKIRRERDFNSELAMALDFVKTSPFGIEVDLDAIPNVASSAMTMSGFSVEEVRQYVSFFASNPNAGYLHIAEGAPSLGDAKDSDLIGKLIGYMVTDFIKANYRKVEGG